MNGENMVFALQDYNPENKEYDKSKILSINSFDKIKEMF